jgi:hypothetical protein
MKIVLFFLFFLTTFSCKKEKDTGLSIKVINAQALRDSFYSERSLDGIFHFASVEIQNNAFDTVFFDLSRTKVSSIRYWAVSKTDRFANGKQYSSDLTFTSRGDSILAIPKDCKDTIYLRNDPLDFNTVDSVVYSGSFTFSHHHIRRDSTLEISIIKSQKNKK